MLPSDETRCNEEEALIILLYQKEILKESTKEGNTYNLQHSIAVT